jgi:hypothetical protein
MKTREHTNYERVFLGKQRDYIWTQQKIQSSLTNILFFLLQQSIATINLTTVCIKTVSLFIIYTPTCFDISMLSSGSFTFVPCQVT